MNDQKSLKYLFKYKWDKTPVMLNCTDSFPYNEYFITSIP